MCVNMGECEGQVSRQDANADQSQTVEEVPEAINRISHADIGRVLYVWI